MKNNIISMPTKGTHIEHMFFGISDLELLLCVAVVESSRDRPEDPYPSVGTFQMRLHPSLEFAGVNLMPTLLLCTSFDLHYQPVKLPFSVISKLGFRSLDIYIYVLHIPDSNLFYFQEFIRLQSADLFLLHLARLLGGSLLGFSIFDMSDSINRKTYEAWVFFRILDLMNFMCFTGATSRQRSLILAPSRLRPEDHISLSRNLQLHINIESWIHFQLTSPWICSLPKILTLGMSETLSNLKIDEFFLSFTERAFSLISSLWKRSLPPPFSAMERLLTYPPFASFMEERFEIQSQNLPLSVDILIDLMICFLSNSIERFEPKFQSDSLTDVMLSYSDKTHIEDLFGILRDCQVLQKCVKSICLFCCYLYISLVVCIREIGLLMSSYRCISEI